MSGTLVINENIPWMVQNYMHDDVLKMMADRLPHEDAQLRDLLMNGCTDRGVGYCDLRNLDSVQFNKLISVAAASYLKMRSDGPQSFALPKYYPGYMKQFEILLDMLKNDPRARGA
jgi:hypothetical protein